MSMSTEPFADNGNMRWLRLGQNPVDCVGQRHLELRVEIYVLFIVGCQKSRPTIHLWFYKLGLTLRG